MGMHHSRSARTRAAVLAVACAGVLTLTGCGGGDEPPATGGTSAAASPGTPSGSPPATPHDAASAVPSATAGSSASPLPDDWMPEEPTVLATGQKVPDDYEPATLEHPARNVPRPVMPEAAKAETEEGAQAFLNYRADAQWYAFQTGDTSLVRELTSSSCERCQNQFARIEENFSKDSWMSGGAESATILPNSFTQRATGQYTIPVNAKSSGVAVIKNKAIKSKQRPYSSDRILDVSIIRKSGHWLYITASPRGAL